MLEVWHRASRVDRHEQAFLARHDQILKWSRQLCADRPWQAEDLAQDAFVQFMAMRPDLDRIGNLDGYLFTLVRNLYRSPLYRNWPLRPVSLSILDFDSIEDGLRSIDRNAKEHLRKVAQNLTAICEFACQRKETSKAGSLLILRFFHGFGVHETAAIMGISRAAVDERLRLARKEAHEYLLERVARAGGKLVALKEPDELGQGARADSDLLDALEKRIFAAARGRCLSKQDFERIYPVPPRSVDHATLAHIACCRACLAGACRHRQLPPANQSPKEGGGNADASAKEGSQPVRRQRIQRWKRRLDRVLEHRPQELRIAVNGLPLANHALVSGRGELSISVPMRDEVEFVEVLSEQDVRLLMLQVESAPPAGEFRQSSHLNFTDGRVLSITLTFTEPWPTIHIHYAEPQASEAGLIEDTPNAPVAASHEIAARAPFAGVLNLRHLTALWSPRFWTPAIAVLLIVAVLFVQTRETTASAAVLVERMEGWQRKSAPPAMVLHRTFDFTERALTGRPGHSGEAKRRHVEVWRKPDSGAKISRIYSESGALLETARLSGSLPTLTASNAWQFEPAPDTFRALAGDLKQSRVSRHGDELQLASAKIRLRVDSQTYKPLAETVETGGTEFEFRETATGATPESLSPLAPSAAESPSLPPAPVRPSEAKRPEPPAVVLPHLSAAELDATEVAARLALHRLNADLGEEIHVLRREQEIDIAGIVDSARRKEEIQAAVRDLPHIRTSLVSPEDLAASANATDRVREALASTPMRFGNARRPALLEPWLRQKFPDEAASREFVGRVLALSRQSLSRAYALKELAGRYGDVSRVDPAIATMWRDHLSAFRRSWTELLAATEPAAGPETHESLETAAGPSADRTARLLNDLNEFDRCLSRLFAEGTENQESTGPEAELQRYWRLRRDATTLSSSFRDQPF